LRIRILGRTEVTLDGEPVQLSRRSIGVLERLVAADGAELPGDRIYLDVWGDPGRRLTEVDRNQVHKHIGYIRDALEPGVDRKQATLPKTNDPAATGQPSTYSLVLDASQADYLEFTDLVTRATRAHPATAVAMLRRAIELWRGDPFADVARASFARPLADRLSELYRTARDELATILAELGRPEEALAIAENLAADYPDERLADRIREIRALLRAKYADEILRREFPGLGVTVTVRLGDLLAQKDANLVMGFGDTFDTITDDVIIARRSMVGQLVEHGYGGDRKALDRDLRAALRRVIPLSTESKSDKPRGNLRRYPVGTVAAVPFNGHLVFAVVHCRQDADYVTRSSPAELRIALEQAWSAVRRLGLLKPAATYVLGSGLSRVSGVTSEQLMIEIIDTFLAACADGRCATELRIMLTPASLGRIRVSDVARYVEALDHDGRAPQ
jgi:hypothetical protein